MSVKQAAEDLRKVLDETKTTMTVTTEEGTVTVEPRTGDELFDGSVYTDPRLKIERNGRRITDIEVGFSGTVPLNRYDHDDVAWHQGLVEGSEVELHITATVTKDGFTFKRATEKDGAKLVERKTLEVHSFEIASE